MAARPRNSEAVNTKQIAADIQDYLRKTTQAILKRNIRHEDIPEDDLDVLYEYLGVRLIVDIFPGASFKQQVREFDNRIKIKKAEKEAAEKMGDDSLFEPYDPAGLGDWQYAERIKQKVFRSLESILNQSIGSIGHNQFVQAAKTLLDQAEKTKTDAAEVMMAYEKQLLVLAEHLVERFLPEVGKKLKFELRQAEQTVIKKLNDICDCENEKEISIWFEAIDSVVRGFDLKRYELLLAETMAESNDVSEAFNFTKDLIENYKQTDTVHLEDKETQKLKKFIGKRKKYNNENGLN